MPIVLLEPPRPQNPKRFEDVVNAPLSACLFTGYIASVLQDHKIEAEVMNTHLCDWSIEQTIAYLSKKNPSLLCVHTVYLWEETQVIFDMLSTLKSNGLAAHINLYGYYPTFAYKKILTDFPFIDSVTVGEPEFTILDLARHILSKKNISVEVNIPGLAFRDRNGKVVFYPRPPVQNLDQLPYPARQDMNLYQKKGIVTYIQGSRGCYGHCTFCYLNPFYGQTNQWRGRSAKNIFDEIFKLYTEHAITNFYFSDANYFGPGKAGKERAITLAELILTNNLDICFGFECRANDIEEYTLSRLVMAGLTNVFLGLESGDPASLKRFKKHTTVEENKKAIQLLREYGIEPTFGFIVFEPNSTLESVRNNFEFLKEMDIMTTPAVTAHLLHHRQTLFEGTPDYQSMINDTTGTITTFTNYEAFYKIKDPKVEALSEIVTHVCRTTLLQLPNTFTCEIDTSNAGIKSVSLDVLNNALISLFDRVLSHFETNTIPYSPDKIREMSQKLIHEIKTVMHRQE
ncbi:MAG: radical SAM protein [Candidatus Brocadia sp.]|nr:radical SAM protein [Candidatus Brocadia sp.]